MKHRKMSFIIVMAILPYIFFVVGLIVIFGHIAVATYSTRTLSDPNGSQAQIMVDPDPDGTITATDNLAQETVWSYYHDPIVSSSTCPEAGSEIDGEIVSYEPYNEGHKLDLLWLNHQSFGEVHASNEKTTYAHVCFRVEQAEADLAVYRYDPQDIELNVAVMVTGISLIFVGLLVHLYTLIWLVKTKGDLVRLGADIPSSWLLIVPFAGVYYIYRYGDEAKRITGCSLSGIAAIVLLVFDLMPVAMMIYQGSYNKFDGSAPQRDNVPPPGFGNPIVPQAGNNQANLPPTPQPTPSPIPQPPVASPPAGFNQPPSPPTLPPNQQPQPPVTSPPANDQIPPV